MGSYDPSSAPKWKDTGVAVACLFSMAGLRGLTFSYWGVPTKA